jgi:predicted lipid-binding transport protein (Tim44 family)
MAYEMILMAFERGDLTEVRGFISTDVLDIFDEVIANREAQGLSVEANFIGLREMRLVSANFDDVTRTADITVAYNAEMTSVVRNADGDIVEGDAKQIKRQKDTWTYSRTMGMGDPNWQLVATGE